jgi:hypothetical protein
MSCQSHKPSAMVGEAMVAAHSAAKDTIRSSRRTGHERVALCTSRAEKRERVVGLEGGRSTCLHHNQVLKTQLKIG